MKELKTTQKVRIELKIPDEESIKFECVVQAFEEDRIHLIYPKHMAKYAHLFTEGAEIEAQLFTANGIKTLYSVIISPPFNDILTIEYDYESIDLTYIQRREYVRVPASMDILLYKNNSEFKGTTLNLGGGGIKFMSPKEFKVDDLVRFKLISPCGIIVEGNGKIINSSQSGNYLNYFFHVICFTTLLDKERDKLFKLIFKTESDNLKKLSN